MDGGTPGNVFSQVFQAFCARYYNLWIQGGLFLLSLYVGGGLKSYFAAMFNAFNREIKSFLAER